MENKSPVTHIRGKISVPYRYSFGPLWTEFSIATRDNRILGTKCSECGAVYVPPQHFCTLCYIDITEKVELKDTGVALASAVVYLPFPGAPREPPYIMSQIKLDGAGTIIWHMLGDIAFDKIRPRMPVKAVWREDRKGEFADIRYFQPLE